MNAPKINGYTEEEAKNLVEYIWNGKKAGKRSRIFSERTAKSTAERRAACAIIITR